MTARGAKSHYRADLAGQQFGRLTVLSYAETRNGKAHWLCVCVCGNKRIVASQRLLNGASASCGCLRSELLSRPKRKDNWVGSATYSSWASAKARCFTPTNNAYPRYGAVGITMCSRWRESFDAFLADMGERPDGMTLDRYPDQAGNYEPGNCRWATPKQQAQNRRDRGTAPVGQKGLARK